MSYVYFSRLDDLIINEPTTNDQLYDLLVDIGENAKPTGRFFAVEVKSYDVDHFLPKQSLLEQYKNLPMPVLLVVFDNNNDHG